MLSTGKAVPDPKFTPPKMWDDKANEIMSLLAVVCSGRDKLRPKGIQYIEKCCSITETMKENCIMAPITGHDLFQMSYMYRNSLPNDWIPVIDIRQDSIKAGVCLGFGVYIDGDSTFRYSKESGKRDKPNLQRTASHMLNKGIEGPVEAEEFNYGGTGIEEMIKDLKKFRRKKTY